MVSLLTTQRWPHVVHEILQLSRFTDVTCLIGRLNIINNYRYFSDDHVFKNNNIYLGFQ